MYDPRRTDLKVLSLFLPRMTGRETQFLVGLIPCTNFIFRVLSHACLVSHTLATRYSRMRRTELGVRAFIQGAEDMERGLGV